MNSYKLFFFLTTSFLLFIEPGKGPIFFNQATSKQQTSIKNKFGCGGLEQKCMLLYGKDKAF